MSWFDLATPIVYCAMVVVLQMVRYPRFLAATITWIVAWFANVALLTGDAGYYLAVALSVAGGVAIVWPWHLGLTGPRRHGRADEILRQASKWMREPDPDEAAGVTLIERLSLARFPDGDPDWSTAGSLFRCAVVARRTAGSPDRRRIDYFASAARSYWREAVDRGLLGGRYRHNVWDEHVALACHGTTFWSLLPRQALADPPLVPLGGWDDEAERVIDATRGAPVQHPIAVQTRDALVIAMTAQLAVARGDHSPDAIERQAATTAAVEASWEKLGRAVRAAFEPPIPFKER